ncbi:OmpH family outer membrane protein [Lacinutrix sp. C3R15]|uniref:OmpH family outer membrane protein n=1 Tax=Flavobacteriaceae TaxID=49546 RepID=UPI001C09E2B1|nr:MULTISPECIES: OmpH family outer membrane protein [Flavobacteriaceae]MBU2940038.1 OmpH family outer membrane protein [Lacinutrix sp. C3R15]MDO6623355.1 OmpH family outer membrane protein [Oceanihabitans sp. 1_MG-2023]
MKIKVLFLLAIVFMLSVTTTQAQRGVRIGYIDTEYILENIPEYQEATTQLDGKVQKWKSEIENRLSVIEQKRKDLSNEKTLLTSELVKEREEDIHFEELEILEYQQNRFGPNGDLMIQKRQLIQPIQDQIFAAVQDIAATKKYDFIFDKSADVVMLYSADRFDISEQVIRAIVRTAKRDQANSKKERREAKDEDVVPEVNETLDARKQALEDKKAARAAEAEQRRKEILEAREAKKEAAQRRRDSIIEARKQLKEETLKQRNNTTDDAIDAEENVAENNKEEGVTTETENVEKTAEETTTDKEASATEEEDEEDAAAKKISDREARKQALEERKRKILEERKKAKEERENNNATEGEDN